MTKKIDETSFSGIIQDIKEGKKIPLEDNKINPEIKESFIKKIINSLKK